MTRGEVLERAEFHPKLRLYLVVQGALVLAATIVGIVLIPLWLLAGPFWARRRSETGSWSAGTGWRSRRDPLPLRPTRERKTWQPR